MSDAVKITLIVIGGLVYLSVMLAMMTNFWENISSKRKPK